MCYREMGESHKGVILEWESMSHICVIVNLEEPQILGNEDSIHAIVDIKFAINALDVGF